jgi:SecD/SecF fusion protein
MAGYDAIVEIESSDRLKVRIFDIQDTTYIRRLLTLDQSIEFCEIYGLNELIPALQKVHDLDLAENSTFNTNQSTLDTMTSETEEVKDLIKALNENDPRQQHNLSNLIVDFSGALSNDASSQWSALAFIKLSDTARARLLFSNSSVKDLLPTDADFLYGEINNNANKTIVSLFAVKNKKRKNEATIDETDLKSVSVDFDKDYNVQVNLEFTSFGSMKWEHITRVNTGRFIAIRVNDFVISAPRVNSAIKGGRTTLTGAFNYSEAKMISAQLQGGRLPTPVAIKSVSFKKLHGATSSRDILVFCGFFLVLGLVTYFSLRILKTA